MYGGDVLRKTEGDALPDPINLNHNKKKTIICIGILFMCLCGYMTSVAAPVDELPDPLSIPDPLEGYSLHPHGFLPYDSTYNEFSLQ
jgi:hypothetical protein